jgi:hypothetical protein
MMSKSTITDPDTNRETSTALAPVPAIMPSKSFWKSEINLLGLLMLAMSPFKETDDETLLEAAVGRAGSVGEAVNDMFGWLPGENGRNEMQQRDLGKTLLKQGRPRIFIPVVQHCSHGLLLSKHRPSSCHRHTGVSTGGRVTIIPAAGPEVCVTPPIGTYGGEGARVELEERQHRVGV